MEKIEKIIVMIYPIILALISSDISKILEIILFVFPLIFLRDEKVYLSFFYGLYYVILKLISKFYLYNSGIYILEFFIFPAGAFFSCFSISISNQPNLLIVSLFLLFISLSIMYGLYVISENYGKITLASFINFLLSSLPKHISRI
ncbi:MAG: hypothetical protein ACP5G1_01560 [Nanopusillaceae archaeon]